MEFQAQPYPTYAYENKYALKVYTWVDDLTGCLMTGGKEVKYSANFLVIFGLKHKDKFDNLSPQLDCQAYVIQSNCSVITEYQVPFGHPICFKNYHLSVLKIFPYLF